MADNSRLQPNIRPLNARIAQQIAASDAKREATRKHYARAHRRRKKQIVFVGLAIASVFMLQLIFGQVRLHAANKTLTKSENQLAVVQKSNDSLKKEASQLQDENYLKQILRDRYGYSKKNETIYNLPN
ncbi:FtsB family cell division protein [Fructobacillus papyrifericola]|uniref:Septum formation initiator family protein n=1 Tax=Fructobacillus papyrifericola TaxID=2713172 RepID=A0ABS5QUG3_9LACO|nr:septum formation initiator family protein [Fructobacillus papyrifericola]MBS9336831.1 septum formation initiator family protein [Fructobacillus papyrifericola]